METGDQGSGLQLAERLAAVSLAIDLGMDQPMEHVLRAWLIAGRLGEHLDLGLEASIAVSRDDAGVTRLWPMPRR